MMRAQVVGAGLIGGSIALGLRKNGWHVTVDDSDHMRAGEAVACEIADAAGIDPEAELTFVATPVPAVVDAVKAALQRGGAVTDVASVKAPIVDAIDTPRFVGGHPMAGSERSGLQAATSTLFDGATWVLTPTAGTDAEAFMTVRAAVTALGAGVVTLAPSQHDESVAAVSHVPHLAASALMQLAMQRWNEDEAVLRLAAGGFRDMTRIAAGNADLWTGITLGNRDA